MENKIVNIVEEEGINPSEFIKNAADLRAQKIQRELLEKQRAEQMIIQEKINRKVRDQLAEEKELKKIKSIEDVLKKGGKIRWELINHNHLKGFVKNKFVFEIKRGMTIFNLYIKDINLLKEGCKKGYKSCSSDIQSIKTKSEKLLKD